MLHISLKNTSGWGLLMKQHSYFPHEKDKHSHKGGIFLPQKDFFYQFIATAVVGEYSIFFRCKYFSVRLLARFHFMNKNVYLAMLVFCSCRSRRYGREQLFCPIKIYSNTSDEMQKYYTFKRVFLQYKTSEIQYFFTTPEMFE